MVRTAPSASRPPTAPTTARTWTRTPARSACGTSRPLTRPVRGPQAMGLELRARMLEAMLGWIADARDRVRAS